jgi:hypothetical protein
LKLPKNKKKIKNPWPESASELYLPSDSRLSAKLMPTFADRGCHVVSVTDPYGRILGFPDRLKLSNPQINSKSFHCLTPDVFGRGCSIARTDLGFRLGKGTRVRNQKTLNNHFTEMKIFYCRQISNIYSYICIYIYMHTQNVLQTSIFHCLSTTPD